MNSSLEVRGMPTREHLAEALALEAYPRWCNVSSDGQGLYLRRAGSILESLAKIQAEAEPQAQAVGTREQQVCDLQNEIAGLCIDAWRAERLSPDEMCDMFLSWMLKKFPHVLLDPTTIRAEARRLTLEEVKSLLNVLHAACERQGGRTNESWLGAIKFMLREVDTMNISPPQATKPQMEGEKS